MGLIMPRPPKKIANLLASSGSIQDFSKAGVPDV
jgi:hypothetical protein